MHQQLNTTPSFKQASTIDRPATARSALIELDLAQLKHVSGGSPKGTWEPISAVVESPKGTW